MSTDEATLRQNIDVGTPLFVEIQGVQGKLKSKLVGMEPWEYLIIRSPAGHLGMREQLVSGNRVVVRYVHEGEVFAFESYILEVVEKPAHLLILDCPKKVAKKTLRRHERYDCYVPCFVEVDDIEGEGALVDISETGCRCIVPGVREHGESRPPAEGMEIRISYRNPAVSEPPGEQEAPADEQQPAQVVLRGTIINTTEYHSAARVGVEFSDQDEATERLVKKLIGSLYY